MRLLQGDHIHHGDVTAPGLPATLPFAPDMDAALTVRRFRKEFRFPHRCGQPDDVRSCASKIKHDLRRARLPRVERYFPGSLKAGTERSRLPKSCRFGGLRATGNRSDDCQDGERTQNQFHITHISFRSLSASTCFELIQHWTLGVRRRTFSAWHESEEP